MLTKLTKPPAAWRQPKPHHLMDSYSRLIGVQPPPGNPEITQQAADNEGIKLSPGQTTVRITENCRSAEVAADPASFTLNLSGVNANTTVTAATFSFGTGPDTFLTGHPVPVPGPIVGAGLPELIAACGGLLALARRRRKVAAV